MDELMFALIDWDVLFSPGSLISVLYEGSTSCHLRSKIGQWAAVRLLWGGAFALKAQYKLFRKPCQGSPPEVLLRMFRNAILISL
jgi:hypothetical protein